MIRCHGKNMDSFSLIFRKIKLFRASGDFLLVLVQPSAILMIKRKSLIQFASGTTWFFFLTHFMAFHLCLTDELLFEREKKSSGNYLFVSSSYEKELCIGGRSRVNLSSAQKNYGKKHNIDEMNGTSNKKHTCSAVKLLKISQN